MTAVDSDPNGRMKGSVLVVKFASEQEVANWVAEDPYVLGDVWKEWTISPFRMAPFPK